jgi:hypothetical protein
MHFAHQCTHLGASLFFLFSLHPICIVVFSLFVQLLDLFQVDGMTEDFEIAELEFGCWLVCVACKHHHRGFVKTGWRLGVVCDHHGRFV